MHIPDGYLGPQTYLPMVGVMAPFWIVAARKVRNTLKARQVPLLAMGSVFSFLIMMFNIPAPGGSTGHAVGGALIGIVLGPWAALLAVSSALVVQALLFGDGGVTAIGANCFNMGVVMPFGAWAIYRIGTGTAASTKRKIVAAGVAGYFSLNLAALTTAVMFGIQPALAHRPDGTPLYAPYPLSVAVPAMMTEHLVLFGFIEAIVTSLVVGYLLRADPKLFAKSIPEDPLGSKPLWRRLALPVAVIVILTPLGMLASGTAWGEWSSEEVGQMKGFIPDGLSRLEGAWKSQMPDYAIPGMENGTSAFIAYIVSAIVGITVTGLAIYLILKVLSKRHIAGDT